MWDLILSVPDHCLSFYLGINLGESVCKQNFSFVASWYRPPGSTSEEFQLFREQLDYIRTHHQGKSYPQSMS